MARTGKLILPVLLLAAAAPAGAWGHPSSVTDISTTNLYGLTAALKAEDPELEKIALVATRRISADRAIALTGAGGFPWWSGPFAIFLVDTSSGVLVGRIAAFSSVDPQNTMPDIKAAGAGFVTIVHEDVDHGAERARRKYFFDPRSGAPAADLADKPVRISGITRFGDDLFFTGGRGDDGVIVRLGLKNGAPAADDWAIVDDIGGKPLSPTVLSTIENNTLRLHAPSETYAFDGGNWTRLPGPDARYFRPRTDPCSAISSDQLREDFSLYDKCDKERYVQGDAALAGHEGLCDTDNPGVYARLPDSYTGSLERHALAARLIDVPGKPPRRFFVWTTDAYYDKDRPTGIYELKAGACKFHPMPMPDREVLRLYRPDRAERGCGLNDKLGPFQKLGGRIWFCKEFYGGEGQCGVGAAGFFDMRTKTFEILYSTPTAGWSCSALLAEENTVWLGLHHNGEGWGKTGGLAAVDPVTGEAAIHDVPAGIRAVQRAGDLLFIGTDEGIFTLGPSGGISFIGPATDKAGNATLFTGG